jgi:ribA/ribD-fused uncharacterized protein
MKTLLDFELVSKYYGKYVFFYSGYLSNWYPAPFMAPLKSKVIRNEVPEEFNNIFDFNCSEQYMMLQKALRFSDFDVARLIMNSNHPSEQKSLGRQVKNFDVLSWNQISRSAVYEGCYHKFTQNKECFDYLLSTDGFLLVEASPTDDVWGIGRGGYGEDIEDLKTWKGSNWLGEVLTLLRENLQETLTYRNPYE